MPIVEREHVVGRAAELALPLLRAGGHVERDDAAVLERDVDAVGRERGRRVNAHAELRPPDELAVVGAKCEHVASDVGRHQPSVVPDQRHREFARRTAAARPARPSPARSAVMLSGSARKSSPSPAAGVDVGAAGAVHAGAPRSMSKAATLIAFHGEERPVPGEGGRGRDHLVERRFQAGSDREQTEFGRPRSTGAERGCCYEEGKGKCTTRCCGPAHVYTAYNSVDSFPNP